MRKREKKRHRKSVGVLLVILCMLLVYAAYQYRESGDIKGVLARIAGKEEIPYQKVSEEIVGTEGKYYYQQLDEEEQNVYQELLQGIQDHEAQIYVHSQDAGRTNEILTNVLKDYPEIFWSDGTATATSYSGLQNYTVVSPGYLYSKDECEEKQAQIDAAVSECLSGISENASDYEKILYAYEYIVNHVDYDDSAEDNQNICSVFIGKKSVCAGYSKAMQYMLEKQKIFCTYVTGTVTGSLTGNGEMPHAWNLVKCDGDYYHVDVTWGDPIFQEGEGEEDDENVTEEETRDNISYDYMLCDDEELFRTHTLDSGIELPACTKMDKNYYVVNGIYYTQYDGQTALKAMNQAISEGQTKVVLKYSDESVYETAKKDILNNEVKRAAQNLAQWYHLSEVSYSYIDDKKMNKITIFWKYT
mgnify:CR=1 FL=1